MIEKLQQSHPKIYKHFFTVTTFSKLVALSMFIVLPFVGFYLGMKYQQEITVVNTPIVSEIQKIAFPTPTVQIRNVLITNTPGKANLANPASVYCSQQGGENKIVTARDGSQSGQCVFSDGRKCDEWQFFRTKICK